MSFLLRKPARGVPAAGRAPPPHRGVPSKSKAASRPMTASRGGQMQQQQLLQRRPTTIQQQRTTQSTKHKSQQVSKETQEELQGVISMDEVMEDLRVLEQQQRESQRKLAAIKLTKQHKLEQKSSIESKLSSLKYANGEQRAQLVRARDVLSRSTREIGSSKLRSEKSGDALKGFDTRLKRALLSARILLALRRKVDSETIALRNKRCIILRAKPQVLDRLDAAKKLCDDTKQREQSLRKGIQDEKVQTKNLFEQTASVQSDANGLGQDLAAAQAMAASTKLRAESIATEVVAEDKRSEGANQEMRSKFKAYEKEEAEKKARNEALQKEIKLKNTQLLEAWKRLVQYQQEEGHELSPEPSDDGPAPSLDVTKCKAELEEERAALLAEQAGRDRLKKSSSASEEDLSELVSKDATAKDEAESIRNEAEVAQKVERERQESNDKCLDEIEKERASVSDLRRSVSELEESIGSERKRAGDRYSEQTGTIEKRQIELEKSKTDLASAVTTVQELESAFEEDEEHNARLVEAAKQEADSARSAFEEARQEVESLEGASDLDIQKEAEDIRQAQSILLEDTKDEIAQLCEDYPALEEVEVDYDPEKTIEEMAEEALSSLRADCEARVEQARAEKKAAERKSLALKKEKEAAEHAAQLKAQRKEAEASRKRKEERRNERMRKEAMKRESDDGKHKRRSSGGGILTSVQGDGADRVQEAAEEPLAASQKRIRFEDEEEVGSLVTNLSFGRTRETKRTYGKSTSRAHGRRESFSSGKSKPKKVDGKERESSLKEPSRSRSDGDKIARSREASKSSKRLDGADVSRDRRSSKPQSTKSRSSKDHSSRSSSLAPHAEDCSTTKRPKDTVSIRTAGSKSKSRHSSGSRSANMDSSLVGGRAGHGRKSSSSRSNTKSSSRQARDPKCDDNRSLTKSSTREARESHSSSRSSKPSSREGRESKKDDRSMSSQKSKSQKSSRPSTKSSSRKATESKRDDNCTVSSHKSSRTVSSHKSSRTVSSHKSSRSVSSHKSSSKRKDRDSECASQASGISTMERVSKSRRRKKKDGPTTTKSKMTSFSSMGGVQDVDFHF